MQIAALLLIGVVGMEIAGVQPVLLDSLLTEHRLTSFTLGWAATAELLTIGAGLTLSEWFLPPRRLRLVGLLACGFLLIVNLVALRLGGLFVVVDRALAGLAEGVLIWMPACMVARSPSPGRWAGAFLALQGLGQVAFVTIAPSTAIAAWGANGGLLVLAATNVLALLALPWLPGRFAPLAAHSQGLAGAHLRSPAVWGVLLSVFLITAFSLGLFNYLGPLAQQAALKTSVLDMAVIASLVMQIVGPILASVLARRLSYFPIFCVCVLINGVVLFCLGASPGPVLFVAVCALFGFFWLFFLPFQVLMAIEADPTRATTMLLPGAQLLGGAAGPALCSLFVTPNDAHGALWVCGACFLAAFLVSAVIHFRIGGRSAEGVLIHGR
ncbi:MAG: MFS transporter [Caulobacteraceae bacterium]